MAELIGDVKYSILEPGIFLPKSPGWELLVAKELDILSALGSLGIMSLPDGRGVFIRSMNDGRDPQTGDADGDRVAGTYQKDQFENHNHDVSYEDRSYCHFVASGMGIQSNDGDQSQRNQLNIQIGNKGGNETRPRNITLYLYIKTS